MLDPSPQGAGVGPRPAHSVESLVLGSPSAESMNSMRESMQRLLQARQLQLQQQNQLLDSDGESHAADNDENDNNGNNNIVKSNGVLSLSVAADGQAMILEGDPHHHYRLQQHQQLQNPQQHLQLHQDHLMPAINNNNKQLQQLGSRRLATPSAPPGPTPSSSNRHNYPNNSNDNIRSAFQVPRPVSAPLGGRKPQSAFERPETVDMDLMEKLSPRAFPHAPMSPPARSASSMAPVSTTVSAFRSPSAPPAPFFPHRDSDEDDDDDSGDDDEDREENDPYLRQILQQFKKGRLSAGPDNNDEDTRRFSEGFGHTKRVSYFSFN